MTHEELFQAVATAPTLEAQLSVVKSGMRQALHCAAATPDGARSERDMLMKWQQYILGLLQAPMGGNTADVVAYAQRRVRLVQESTQSWLSELKRLRYRHRARTVRRDYRDENCGAPPFRDYRTEALRLVQADAWSRPDEALHRHPFDTVAPYVDHRRTQAARAAAYRHWCLARKIEAADLRSPREQALIGQRGVFAARPIPEGTCVGVYGGQLMDDVDVFLIKDDRYVLALRNDEGIRAVNGENLMSLTNTLFEYDEAGQPAGHPETGYTLKRVIFPTELSGGWRVAIAAFFTTRDISQGEELRWNYALKKI